MSGFNNTDDSVVDINSRPASHMESFNVLDYEKKNASDAYGLPMYVASGTSYTRSVFRTPMWLEKRVNLKESAQGIARGAKAHSRVERYMQSLFQAEDMHIPRR